MWGITERLNSSKNIATSLIQLWTSLPKVELATIVETQAFGKVLSVITSRDDVC